MALCVEIAVRAFGEGKLRINSLARSFFASQPAPFSALLVSSPQVNANLIDAWA